jgi:hypothetical protein
MTSRLLLLAGAAALVLTSASAEPQHGPKCPPGQQNCAQDQPGGNQAGQQGGPRGQQSGPQQGGQQGGPQGQQSGPQQGGQQGGPQGRSHGPQAGGQGGSQGGPAFQGGPGGQKHDRYWRSDFRGGFAARDRIFSALRHHQYNRFDGDPYWFNGRYVVRTFDRQGRPVIVEINPYTGEFIGVINF